VRLAKDGQSPHARDEAPKTTGGIVVPLKLEKARRGTSRFELELTLDRKKRDHGTLHIRFGPHALSAPVVMKPR
jgi:hypothetical protein